MGNPERKTNPGSSAKGEIEHNKSPIQVLNASFPRCGTMSIQAALDQLGYKCWHSTTCFGDKEQCRRWIDAQDAKFLGKGTPFTRSDWDAVFRSYTAISADPPATGFATDLITAYPDAKVILVERDEDPWYDSFSKTVASHVFRWDLHAASDLDPDFVGPVRDMHAHWVHSWWGVDNKHDMCAKARTMYREHNRRVRAATPPDRLLVLSLEDGWGPLCKFLGKDVPDVPFPVKNDRAQDSARIRWIRLRGIQLAGYKILKILGPLFAGVVALWVLPKYL